MQKWENFYFQNKKQNFPIQICIYHKINCCFAFSEAISQKETWERKTTEQFRNPRGEPLEKIDARGAHGSARLRHSAAAAASGKCGKGPGNYFGGEGGTCLIYIKSVAEAHSPLESPMR